MKTTKRLWPFVLADNKLAEEYLEKQASKGLVLESINIYGLWATYRKEEPQKRRYCVDGFKGKKEEQGRYIRMAKDAGWHYVAELPGHIFFSADPGTDPVPTQTDWREEYLQIRKGLWSQDIPLGIFTTIFLLLIGWLWKALEVEGGLPMDWQSLYSYAIFGFILIGFVKALWFYLKSAIAIRTDVPMKPASMRCAMVWGYTKTILGIGAATGVSYRCITILAKDFQGGIDLASFAGGSLVIATILCIIIGLRVIKTDDLGRRVFPTDKKAKILIYGSWILVAVTMLIYFAVSQNV